jgi:hypothetical protein
MSCPGTNESIFDDPSIRMKKGGSRKKGGFERMDDWAAENAARRLAQAEAWSVKANQFLTDFPTPSGPVTPAVRRQAQEAYIALRSDPILSYLGYATDINENYRDQIADILDKVGKRYDEINFADPAEGGRRRKTHRRKRIRKSTGRRSRQ